MANNMNNQTIAPEVKNIVNTFVDKIYRQSATGDGYKMLVASLYVAKNGSGVNSDVAYIEVKIHPFIKPLMKRYEGSTHVFSFYKKYVVPENFNNNINRGLKDLGRAIGLPKRLNR